MKFLKILLFILLGLIVVFVAVGSLKRTVTYGHEITVNKPAAEAWAVMQDESKYADWLEGFKSIEHTGGEHNAVGSTYKIVIEPGEGQPPLEMTETIMEIEEFKRIRMKYESLFGEMDHEYTYTEQDGSTSIQSTGKLMGNSMMNRVMFAIMELAGGFTTQEAKNMEALKKVIEANTTDYYPVEVEAVDSLQVVE